MNEPIICFGQQPCGFFRSDFSKIATARRLRTELVARSSSFHDSDHDYRETITVLREQKTGREDALNFQFANKIQKQFSPLYAKRVLPEWQTNLARQLPNYVTPELVDHFKAVKASNVAEFCQDMYARMGLLDGMRVERSSDPDFRRRATQVDDYFVDVSWEGEIVRARYREEDFSFIRARIDMVELLFQSYGRRRLARARYASALDAIGHPMHPLRVWTG